MRSSAAWLVAREILSRCFKTSQAHVSVKVACEDVDSAMVFERTFVVQAACDHETSLVRCGFMMILLSASSQARSEASSTTSPWTIRTRLFNVYDSSVDAIDICIEILNTSVDGQPVHMLANSDRIPTTDEVISPAKPRT